MGSGEKCSLFINKERIKNLFSIAIEGESSKALYVEPKQQNAVPHEVAMALNMPEVRISMRTSNSNIMKNERVQYESDTISICVYRNMLFLCVLIIF